MPSPTSSGSLSTCCRKGLVNYTMDRTLPRIRSSYSPARRHNSHHRNPHNLQTLQQTFKQSRLLGALIRQAEHHPPVSIVARHSEDSKSSNDTRNKYTDQYGSAPSIRALTLGNALTKSGLTSPRSMAANFAHLSLKECVPYVGRKYSSS